MVRMGCCIWYQNRSLISVLGFVLFGPVKCVYSLDLIIMGRLSGSL